MNTSSAVSGSTERTAAAAEPGQAAGVAGKVLIDYIPAAVLVIMVFHVVVNAISRSVFSTPIDDTLEIAQYWYLPVLTLIGFVSAALRNEHIRANLLYDRLPPVPKAFADRGGSAFCAIVCALFCVYGVVEALEAWHVEMTAGSSTLTVWPVYLLVPLPFAALTIIFARAAVIGTEDSDPVTVAIPAEEATESPR